MTIANTISLLGGLGFFLFGMSLLSDGLKRVAGSKLEVILGRLTSTTFRGVLLGAFVTAVIQSSSATTVMVVGFVNSGIVQLVNAIGIIMGANIGTTATSWILVLAGVEGNGAFSSATFFALIAFVGIILFFFCRSQTKKNIGMIMLAFAVLMSGMQTMSASMEPLKESRFFLDFMSAVSNPFLSMILGIAITALIQSCSASIGILQALSLTGVITYQVAIPMIVGMCIGACVPVLLSAIGANINGKRAAFIYLYFNLAGAAILMIPFYIVHLFVGFDFMSTAATSMGIAIVNTIFKVAATIILMPFAKQMKRVAELTIKEKNPETDEIPEENLLDERFLNYPPLALEQCGKTLEQMVRTAFKNLSCAISLLGEYDKAAFDKIQSREDRVDRYEDRLGSYITRLHKNQLSEQENVLSAKYLNCLSNVERISDHALNIAELAQELHEKRTAFSDIALKEMQVCIDAIQEISELTQKALLEDDTKIAKCVEPLEEVIDILTKELKLRHVQRVQMNQCTLELGFIYNDCINNFERVADHCSNIAVAVLESEDANLYAHDYLRMLNESEHGDYRDLLSKQPEKYVSVLDELK